MNLVTPGKSFNPVIPAPTENDIPDTQYEFNLAEFPLFFLSKRPPEGMDHIIYRDSITGKDKKLVERTWKVTWNEKYGPGLQSTSETFFALFQIWGDSDFNSSFIHFGTLNAILKRRGLSDGVLNFQALMVDLHRLCNIYIEAKNAFWDSNKQKYVDAHFHLFEGFWLEKDSEGNPDPTTCGFIRASETLFSAVSKNTFRLGIDEEAFFKLPGLQQRLFLYLKKIFKFQKFHNRAILDLARQLPLYVSVRKKLRQELRKACDELLASGLLPQFGGYKLIKAESRSSVELIRFERSDARQLEILNDEKNGAAAEAVVESNFQAMADTLKDKHSFPFYRLVAQKMDTDDIMRALGEAKDFYNAVLRQGRSCNIGKVFTTRIKSIASQHDIDLL